MIVTIQIGNSDDRLTQRKWSEFVRDVQSTVESNIERVHFSGLSSGDKPWQNAAWIIQCSPEEGAFLKTRLEMLARRYLQTAIAWSESNTTELL